MIDEQAVSGHYQRGDVIDRIVAGLRAAGIDLDRVRPTDLAPVDEFHIGGAPATRALAAKLPFHAGQRLLDVGSGLGGPARFLAEHFGAHVTGIDLTPAYVEAARHLSELTRQADMTDFKAGSALAMPFGDAGFDGAVTIHVAMNIADRAGLYREVARVLRPGATFGIYDIMTGDGAPIGFPMPWASTAAQSHLATPDETQRLLRGGGFEIVAYEDRTPHAKAFFEAQFAAVAKAGGPPPLGLHLITGETHREKFANLRQAVADGRLTPGMIVARKP